ncbi:MAG: hypothetical protein Q9195_006737 [Heterodermia aff. obscurata]
MPVTLNITSHPGRPWIRPPPVVSSEQLLERSCRNEHKNCKDVIQSSFVDLPNESICDSTNGFVRACYHAYSNHHHLTLRPEDIWFAILTQLSFHINAHAEELRPFFVPHEGQEELEVIDGGTIKTVDFGLLAVRMTKEMDKHVVDPDLRQWVMPDFTTTTHTDTVTAAVLLMGAMQEYFTYKFKMMCGIPSVTLLGERDDWVKIQNRLDKLPQLGQEPGQFARLLKPVLEHFVRSFDSPDDPGVRSFWTRIAHQSGGSGCNHLSGWITAFCFWEANGKCLYNTPTGTVDNKKRSASYATSPGCDIDGILYHRVNTNDIPKGYVSLPVTVDDNGVIHKCRMVAGSVGIQLRSSGLPVDESEERPHGTNYAWGPNGETIDAEGGPGVRYAVNLDTIQPVSGWWIYEIMGDIKAGNDRPGTVNSVNSQWTQDSSWKIATQRSSKKGGERSSTDREEKRGLKWLMS